MRDKKYVCTPVYVRDSNRIASSKSIRVCIVRVNAIYVLSYSNDNKIRTYVHTSFELVLEG